jgi:hypothetical protein
MSVNTKVSSHKGNVVGFDKALRNDYILLLLLWR